MRTASFFDAAIRQGIMDMKYIRNAKVVLENGILWDGAVITDGDRIRAVGHENALPVPDGAEVIDAQGAYVGPGFVDIHVHGGEGIFLYQDPRGAVRHFLENGETTVLAALYYDVSKEEFLSAIGRVKEAMGSVSGPQDPARALGGIYMEGPYMNPKYGAGSDLNQWKGPILAEDYEPIVDAAGDLVKVWAVAPEREGLMPFLTYAKKVNPTVAISAGHTEATPEEMRKYKRMGLISMTHCMNATGRIEKLKGVRAAGPDEACLTDPDMYAEIICDSQAIHVNPDNIRLILRCKGVDKTILITDSFVSYEESPEDLRYIKDLVFDGNRDLNGSKMTMNIACRNIMTHTNCGIAQAFLMASRNPARLIGMEDEIGTIEEGKRANLVFVDDTFEVKRVMLEGEFFEE